MNGRLSELPDYCYGPREDGTPKASGFFGEIPLQSATPSYFGSHPLMGKSRKMTEFSVGVPINGREMLIPSVVPTLTSGEVGLLMEEPAPSDIPRDVMEKIINHAKQRINSGMSPFWGVPEKYHQFIKDNMEVLR